jgi:hypothetical protein
MLPLRACLVLLVCATVVLHALQVLYVSSLQPPAAALPSGAAAPTEASGVPPPPPAGSAVGGHPRMLIATATQPAPCTTAYGDHVIQLSLKNKLQYATLHGYAVWPSTELLSPWDLGGQWNKGA